MTFASGDRLNGSEMTLVSSKYRIGCARTAYKSMSRGAGEDRTPALADEFRPEVAAQHLQLEVGLNGEVEIGDECFEIRVVAHALRFGARGYVGIDRRTVARCKWRSMPSRSWPGTGGVAGARRCWRFGAEDGPSLFPVSFQNQKSSLAQSARTKTRWNASNK